MIAGTHEMVLRCFGWTLQRGWKGGREKVAESLRLEYVGDVEYIHNAQLSYFLTSMDGA